MVHHILGASLTIYDKTVRSDGVEICRYPCSAEDPHHTTLAFFLDQLRSIILANVIGEVIVISFTWAFPHHNSKNYGKGNPWTPLKSAQLMSRFWFLPQACLGILKFSTSAQCESRTAYNLFGTNQFRRFRGEIHKIQHGLVMTKDTLATSKDLQAGICNSCKLILFLGAMGSGSVDVPHRTMSPASYWKLTARNNWLASQRLS